MSNYSAMIRTGLSTFVGLFILSINAAPTPSFASSQEEEKAHTKSTNQTSARFMLPQGLAGRWEKEVESITGDSAREIWEITVDNDELQIRAIVEHLPGFSLPRDSWEDIEFEDVKIMLMLIIPGERELTEYRLDLSMVDQGILEGWKFTHREQSSNKTLGAERFEGTAKLTRQD